ncbi:four-carbon acid sugar kinase family protein [Sulfobacillus thermosulfidooxidans]|uniref:four-carbon acid sugar kinase family protein n=1 Tax=Sulfobacillus thermosulfidooxidans TaxID=28034 RepID=UPI0006B5C299|nr:four-carbon acid sugar kinase family protein [Sulfobacillus thermosulfidooxidans]
MAAIAVFADDLTGANASAGALAEGLGRPIRVYHDLPPRPHGPVVLNTQSREDPSRSVLVSKWTRKLWQHGYRHFDKRIDTTLRGPCSLELELLIKALPERPWLAVIAAYPGAGRTTRQGRQYLYGRPLTETLPELTTDVLVDYLFDGDQSVHIVTQQEREIANTTWVKELVKTYSTVIFDAASEGDLCHIGAILDQIRGYLSAPLVTVSSGSILPYYMTSPPTTTAIIMGSPTPTNIRQVNYIQNHHVHSVQCISLENSTDYHRPQSSIVVLHSGLEPLKEMQRQPISQYLAERALTHLSALQDSGWIPERLIVTGGEMAQAFLIKSQALHVNNYRLVAPLVSHGIIEGGIFDHCELITKGGLVGEDNLLYLLSLSPKLVAHKYPIRKMRKKNKRRV